MSLIHRTMPFVIIINLLLKNQLPLSLHPVLLLHLLTPPPTADFTVSLNSTKLFVYYYLLIATR